MSASVARNTLCTGSVLLLLAGLAGSATAVTPLGGEFQVNSYTTGDQGGHTPYFNPGLGVASAPGGNFVVVWHSYSGQDGSGSGVFGQRYDSLGAAQGNEFQVTSSTLGSQRYPQVAADAGGFVVVWETDQVGYGFNVFGRRFDDAGLALGTEFQVNSTAPYGRYPAVCSDSAGNSVVVWEGPDGSLSGIFGQRYDDHTLPLGGEFQINTYTTSFQRQPAVGCDESGRFVVVWNTQGGTAGRRYDSSGVAEGDEFAIDGFGDRPRVLLQSSGEELVVWDYSDVAQDSMGNFVVVRTDYNSDGDVEGVFGQLYDSGGSPLDEPFQVNTYTTGQQRHPSIAMDAAGHFVVVWQSFEQDGSGFGVFGQRFDSGVVTTTSTLVTTTTSSSTTTSTTLTTTSTTLPTPLSGAKLLLKDKKDKPQKRKISMISKDPSIGQDDPVAGDGGSLRVYSGSAAGAFNDVYDLPASNWRPINKNKPQKGFKFKKGDPIKTVIVKPGKLIKIAGKGAKLGHSLAQNPDPVLVELRVGSRSYCFDFGGAQPPKFKNLKRYLAKKAQPGACPPGAASALSR